MGRTSVWFDKSESFFLMWPLISYGICSKISNTFLFLVSNRMLVIRAEFHKMLVRIANWEDPDQTASSETV